jgi:hypothetical protein
MNKTIREWYMKFQQSGYLCAAKRTGRPGHFALHRYMIRNLHCTVTIDSVLANSKTQNAFLFPAHAMFRHDCRLAVKPPSMLRRLVQKTLGEILYLLMCSFLLCVSWLLRSRVRNFRRDLWITLYFGTEMNAILFPTVLLLSHLSHNTDLTFTIRTTVITTQHKI